MKNLRNYYVLAAIPPLFMLTGGIMFRGFVLHAIHINPVLNLFIIAVAVFGIGLIMYNLYKINWEYGKLLSFKAKVDAGESMDDLVASPEYKGSEIGKVLVSVASTKGRLTSRIEQETIERSMAELHAHLEAKTEFPQFLTGFMIALGLLGTFIGLLETLVSTASLIDGFGKASQGADMDASFIHLVGDLQKPLASMGTAFSASMFGLIGSLVLGFTLTTLRGAGKKLQTRARECISDIVEHVIHDMSGPAATVRPGLSEAFLGEFLGDLMVLQRESIMASRNASDSSMQAGLKLDAMNERLASISLLFSESIDESKNMRQLVAVGPRMHETAQQTLEEIRSLGQMINQKMTSARDLSSTLSILEERLTNNGEIALRTFDTIPQLVSLMQSGQNALASALTSIQTQQSDASTINEQTAQTMGAIAGAVQSVVDAHGRRTQRDSASGRNPRNRGGAPGRTGWCDFRKLRQHRPRCTGRTPGSGRSGQTHGRPEQQYQEHVGHPGKPGVDYRSAASFECHGANHRRRNAHRPRHHRQGRASGIARSSPRTGFERRQAGA